MKQLRHYLAIGVAVYLLVLVTTFPVARLVDAIEARVNGLSLFDVEGSLFSGSAGRLLLSGTDLGSAEWTLQPLRLLTGRLEYGVEIRHPEYQGSTRIGVTATGRVYGERLDAQLDPSALLSRFVQMPVLASGDAHLQLDSFVPAASLPEQLSGELAWRGATLTSPLALSLGDVALDIERIPAGIEARVREGGTLGIDGTIMLAAAGNYRVELMLHPGRTVDADIIGLLDTVSQRLPDGSYRIRSTGRLQAP